MSLSIDLQCNTSKWKGVRRTAASNGVDIPDTTSGEVEHNGVTVRFQRDGDNLHVEAVKIPWKYKFVPDRIIIAKVKELFNQI